MQLGRAEERLADQPEARGAGAAAREEAGSAIAELRDLARGIAPPVLADRGLAAAVEALGRRAAMPVARRGRARRPAAAGGRDGGLLRRRRGADQHRQARARARRRSCACEREDDVLVVEVADKGPGGADPAGSGLTGLRQRVEALDGRFTVVSPPGRRGPPSARSCRASRDRRGPGAAARGHRRPAARGGHRGGGPGRGRRGAAADRRRPQAGRRRSSTCGCRPGSPTRGCARRSRRAARSRSSAC